MREYCMLCVCTYIRTCMYVCLYVTPIAKSYAYGKQSGFSFGSDDEDGGSGYASYWSSLGASSQGYGENPDSDDDDDDYEEEEESSAEESEEEDLATAS